MKTKNKFWGRVLSMVAIILCFGFLLTGCGDDKNSSNNTSDDDTSANTSIISLVDAKNIKHFNNKLSRC